MRLIGVTPEVVLPGEAACVNGLFRAGLPLLHVRKPHLSAEELERYIERAGAGFYDRMVLHDCFMLAAKWGVKGVHLNSRNPRPPEGVAAVSKSCHTLEELGAAVGFEYRFFSPVFASISKPDYRPRYSPDELFAARDRGVIGRSVVALGGVEEHTIPLAAGYGFGGVAVLGALWGSGAGTVKESEVSERLEVLLKLCEQ
jgi:thiamine-phosphate pyrophosphorylase